MDSCEQMKPIKLMMSCAPLRIPGTVRRYEGSNVNHEVVLVVVDVTVVVCESGKPCPCILDCLERP